MDLPFRLGGRGGAGYWGGVKGGGCGDTRADGEVVEPWEADSADTSVVVSGVVDVVVVVAAVGVNGDVVAAVVEVVVVVRCPMYLEAVLLGPGRAPRWQHRGRLVVQGIHTFGTSVSPVSFTESSPLALSFAPISVARVRGARTHGRNFVYVSVCLSLRAFSNFPRAHNKRGSFSSKRKGNERKKKTHGEISTNC